MWLEKLTTPKVLTGLNVAAALALLAGVALAVFYAPQERVMGDVQRLFYFHVPAAWVGFAGFLVAVVAGLAYLRTGQRAWDQLSVALIEVGLLFSLITVVTGSVWAYPAWGTWWTWDPRLTTYTIMILLYVAYLMLRQAIEDPDKRARFGAVYSLVAFISVPITFFAIRIWRTIHPAVIGTASETAQGGFDMTAPMVETFLLTNVAFVVIFIALTLNRARQEQLADRVERLKAQLAEA